jgi:hypothetical protein
MKKIICLVIVIFFCLAQDVNFNGASTYRFGKSDEITMNVNLWGHVLKPGSFEIPVGFSLVELISIAGGPKESANLEDIKIVRKDKEIVRVNVKRYINEGDASIIPALKPGDVVIIGGSLRNVFQEVVGYLRDFAIIANAIFLAQNIK